MKYCIKLSFLSLIVFMVTIFITRSYSDLNEYTSGLISFTLGIMVFIIAYYLKNRKPQQKQSRADFNSILLEIIQCENISDLREDYHKLTIEIFENMLDGLVILDNDFIIKYTNPSLCRITSIPRDKLIGKCLHDLPGYLSPSHRENLLSYISTRDKYKHDKYDVELLNENGNGINISVASVPIVDNNGKSWGRYGIVTDITAYKTRESELLLSREKFSSIVEYLSELLWIMDANTIIKFEAPSVSRALGYEENFFLGKNSYSYIHPDDVEIVARGLKRVIENSNHNRSLIFRFKHADGRWIYLEAIANNLMHISGVEGIVVTARDITERRQTDREIRELDKIVNNSPAVAFVWNKETYNPVKYVSRNCLQLTGYTKEEFLSGSILYRNIVHPDDIDSVRNEVNSYSSDVSTKHFDHPPYRIITKDGKTKWVSDSTEINRDENGNVNCFHGIVLDITERMEAIIALRESEKRYKTLIETTPIPTVVHSNYKMVYANASAIKALDGNSISDFLGKSPLEFVHPDYLDVVKERIKNAYKDLKKAEFSKEKFITLTGRVIDVEVIGSVIDYQGEYASLITFTDITETKKDKKELDRLQALLMAAIDNSPAGVLIVSASNDKIQFANSAAHKMHGVSGLPLSNKPTESQVKDWQLYHPDGTQFVFDDLPLAKVLSHKEAVQNVEIIIKNKNMENIWVLANAAPVKNQKGEIIAGIVILSDITEFKKATEELQNSEKRYHELFNSVVEGLCLSDKDDNIEFCNPALAEILEEDNIYSIVGNSFSKYYLPEYKKFIQSEIEKLKKGINSKYEITVNTAKNNKKVLLLSVTARFDDNHNFIGTFASMVDITEIVHLQDLANRAQRLEAAGRIAGQVAHDFNNLLAPLMAYPEFIRTKLPENHPSRQYLDDIEYAAEQMAEINQQLLTLGRRGHYNLEPLSINEIVTQVINQIKPIPDSLNLVLDLDKTIMPVKGGASQIFRAILNLITNARDAMLDAGTITAKTENIYIDKFTGRFESISPGEYVKLTVSDTGTGIPEEIIPKILDPFFTTKAPGIKKGSGLGLSIVHTVMEDHKGYIDLESHPGKGTDFYLYFPITREKIERNNVEKIVGGDEKILVVDDDRIQRTVMVNLLTKLGYRASEVPDGNSAIKFLANNNQDLVILDMIMPEGPDGLETYRGMLEINPDQKAIIVSGYAESERIKKLLELGAGAFIRKPLTLKSLAAAIRQELDNKLQSQKQQAQVNG